MANEKEANLAREQHSDYLTDLGAHGITIDEDEGANCFAVVALFEKKPADMPAKLTVRKGKKTVEVPLRARVAGKYKAE